MKPRGASRRSHKPEVSWSTMVPNWRMKTRRAVLALIAAALPLALSRRPGGSRAKHHALAQHQHRVAHSEHQSDGGAADQSEHRRQGVTTCGPSAQDQRSASVGSGSGRDASLCALFAQPVSGLQLRLSRQRRRMPGSAGRCGRRRRQRSARRARRQATARAATSCRPRSTRARSPNEIVAEIDGALSDAQADELARRHGLDAPGIAEFSADRRHHRPVPHHRPPVGGDREPRTRRRRQRSLGAAEFPLCAAGPEGGIDRGRSGAICAARNFDCREAHTLAHGANVTDRRDRFRDRRSSIPNSRVRSPTPSMRSAARKVRMSTAPASPARSWRMRG